MKWGIRISNSHAKISKEEILTLIREKKITWLHPLVNVVNCSKEVIDEVIRKSASIKLVIQKPHIINLEKNSTKSLFENINNYVFEIGDSISSFAVKCYPIMLTNKLFSTKKIEEELGSKIMNYNQISVDLDNPDKEFSCLILNDKIVIGWKYAEIDFSRISNNSPKKSPFFGGGSMKPMLTKLLVNLLYPHDALILDPFCGHGGILREIVEMKSFAIGIEVSVKVARECKINNYHHSVESSSSIIIGDAVKRPFRRFSIQMIVTDPPYAKQTTTIGRKREKLIQDFLDSLEFESKLVMTLPDKLRLPNPENWKIDFEEKDYVHKSLTRVVRRMEKVC